MKKYRLQEGWLFEAPLCGITADGRAVSNFRCRIERDAGFAEENGYFPMGAEQPTEPPERVGYETEVLWRVIDGCWKKEYRQTQLPTAEDIPLD